MRAATESSMSDFSESRSTMPSASEATSTVSNPVTVAEAGLVPWAESGTMTFVLFVSPRLSCHALIIISPVCSPWAPAAGWRVTASMPVISASMALRSYMSLRAPWTVSTGWRGWIREKPGILAATSLILGLYFMVQEPRG